MNSDVATLLDAALVGDAAADVSALPDLLAAATAAVLRADGASLSLLSLDLRVPLGASNPTAMVAEQLQFTLGEGPCLEVLHDPRPVAHDLAGLERAWPRFARDLVGRTPYRAVASAPLRFSDDGNGGALDLYFRDSEGLMRLDPQDAARAADWVVTRLVESPSPLMLAGADDASAIPWLQTSSTQRRMEVWVAMGVLIDRLGLDSAAALARIRAWARTDHTDLDTTAADIVARVLDPDRPGP